MSTDFFESVRPKKKFEIAGIYTAIDRICEVGFEFCGESHPFWELLYVKEGVVEVVEDENTYALCEGSLICHAPGEFHRIMSVGSTRAHIYVLTLDCDGELPDNLKRGVYSLGARMREEYERCFNQLYFMCLEKGRNRSRHNEVCSSNAPASFVETGNPNRLGHEGLARLTVFLLCLSRLSTNDTQVSTSERARAYSRIVSTMSERVCDGLSVNDIADIHHVSKSYVTKLFRAYAGEGPMKYYSRVRIARVQKLLLDGESLSRIVELMNYSSLAYLSAHFKSRCGMPPIEWLNRARGEKRA